MSKTVQPIVEAVFAPGGEISRPVNFQWRLIRRKGRPFLLLPPRLTEIRAGLNLYSAQRRPAKIWRALLPVMFQTPAVKVFERIQFQADAASPIMQFMAEQAGRPAAEISPAAIKVSEVGSRARLVMLLCDESGRPGRVIKAGVNPAGLAATNREVELLEKLPPNKLGCIRVTGRLTTPAISAFATDYFPGTSPNDDAGMEHLFHAWLNDEPPVPLESLPSWHELAASAGAKSECWEILCRALAGKKIRTTLYHGDFAPWNVRIVNSQNLQAFDWERGRLHGFPGWDWFHFIVQTSVLARGYSVERAAAEVEQLIHSPRFQKYAAAAGISDIAEPLLLAYLLHQCWVIKPLEGAKTTAALFDFLFAHWQLSVAPAPVTPPPAPPEKAPTTGAPVSVALQLRRAARQWSNLFWEPSLNSKNQPAWYQEINAHWSALLLGLLLLAGIATAQFLANTHLLFLHFYLATCALVVWRAGRRCGFWFATLTAVIGPLVVSLKDAGFRNPEVMGWNTLMRFIILQLAVIFVSQLHRQRALVHHRSEIQMPAAKLADTWAVVFGCGLFLALVAWLDYITNPLMIFMPLYLFPAMMITLVLNRRWGIAFVLLSAGISTAVEFATNKISPEVSAWNLVMRMVLFLIVLWLVDRIRKENILFAARHLNHR